MTSLLDDLKNVSQHLSPTFKVKASEALDVLSALVQYAEHGSPLVEAAVQGAQSVADFYHEIEVGKASESGAEAPQKGQPVTATPQAPTAYPGAVPPAAPSTAEIAAEVVRQLQAAGVQEAAANRPTAADVTVTSEPTPEPAPVEPKPADPQTNVFGG